jgi:hypothetical protein
MDASTLTFGNLGDEHEPGDTENRHDRCGQ